MICGITMMHILLLKGLLLLVLMMEIIILEIKKNRPPAFKNNAPSISCVLKMNDVLTENAEDLGVVIPRYNLLE